jgi:hypothetical protein
MARALVVVLLVLPATSATAAADQLRQDVGKIVAAIQRADYEDDRARLKELYDRMAPFAEQKAFASRVKYWRGFAMWRLAINGANDNVEPKELEENLKQAVSEFDASASLDPNFTDAKIGLASCLGYLAFLHRSDQAQMHVYLDRDFPLLRELLASAPDNPRLCWILGPVYWNQPEEKGGGRAKVMETYRRGLDAIRKDNAVRKNKGLASDPLDPSWGEPELLMSLAWTSLNGSSPDAKAAEQYARSALAIVPYWHYLRDVLMPQIQQARAKQHDADKLM